VATFLGLPPATIVEGAKANIALFGAATATPYPAAGAYCAGAPQERRRAMIVGPDSRLGSSATGRPVSIDAAQIRQLRATLAPAAIAEKLGIARSSVYRVLGPSSNRRGFLVREKNSRNTD
jgi:hypothetical protein